MLPLHRYCAALCLALLLPVQGYAAACAQICAAAGNGPMVQLAAAASPDGEQQDAGGNCHDSEPQPHPGKCCSAHTFLVDLGVAFAANAPAPIERSAFVARWTNFIPEEPSPPPIRAVRSA